MNEGDAERGQASQAAFPAKVPVGRWGRPEDVVHVVLPLLAPASAFTTGAVVHVTEATQPNNRAEPANAQADTDRATTRS